MTLNHTMSNPECRRHLLPIRDALDILSGKWKLQILVSLLLGNKRFREMQREVDGITARMLSKELKELEMNRLVKRTVHDTTPVTVEYSLTDYGRSLQPVLTALENWGLEHRRRILTEALPV
ncbi:winged helix-turn-helix transcriptional regulator [Larkinella soli]|uniref:winged helix-turn-helix transcriptional regulator n=1 Tax=Larkinella soli TaxID=1770527 RepID=UPI000FFCBEA2|nr:helix-turn-helix domain-containing protein [Larkinella soli]